MSRLAKMLWIISHQQSNKILFAAGKNIRGQVIIKEEALLVAKKFYIEVIFDSNNWKNTRNMMMLFLIQSILGLNTSIAYWALAGIACIITFILSFGYRRKQKLILLLDLCFNGFSSLVGKKVVDSVLNPFKITTHMLAALLL
jgi:cytochrome c oxidase assembly protein subunit 15